MPDIRAGLEKWNIRGFKAREMQGLHDRTDNLRRRYGQSYRNFLQREDQSHIHEGMSHRRTNVIILRVEREFRCIGKTSAKNRSTY
jgi:hypothetical protein